MSLGLVDSFMVKDIGNYGTAMSAVSNVDQVSSLLIQLFATFGVGGAVITSQLIGAGKIEEANKSAKQLVVLMLLASIVIMTVCLALNHQIVNLFFGGKNDNEEYLGFAYTYFYVMAVSFPFLAVFNYCTAILRAQRKSVNTLVSGAISFVANVGLNALLIYVHPRKENGSLYVLRAPRKRGGYTSYGTACKLGILGAALGTLFAHTKEVEFASVKPGSPAKFYINSSPAHKSYPTVKIVKPVDGNPAPEGVKYCVQRHLGSLEGINKRTINQFIIGDVCESCQLAMGMTELAEGSAWNTLPSHTHERRMEVYMYFELPENEAVIHHMGQPTHERRMEVYMYFELPENEAVIHHMGQPQETRHVIMHNEQAVISPSWSIHSGVGTHNYTFIWGMCGENQTYDDMDNVATRDLK